jgi:hypothetical protein
MHDFHEDLKTMYLTAGVDGKPLVFLLADTEIVHEVRWPCCPQRVTCRAAT